MAALAACTASCSPSWKTRNPQRNDRAPVIPLFPLNTVLFPDGPLPLRIFETRYVDMVRYCMREHCPFGVVLIRAGSEVGTGAVGETSTIGTTARIGDFT